MENLLLILMLGNSGAYLADMLRFLKIHPLLLKDSLKVQPQNCSGEILLCFFVCASLILEMLNHFH